ncbi:MAG TPA: histidine kinase, partial [Anaerolineales bacterium]|nr:histidine kinase [Anaerolineales bacterium]
FYGLSFFGLGLAAYLQLRRGGDFPLRKLLPWLAAFGFAAGAMGWVEMFLASETNPEVVRILDIALMLLQPVSGTLLLIFGWGIVAKLVPLPRWAIFVPGILIVPFAYVITYALSTFVTPSPIEIPIDIWSRYLLYLPGSILAGVGFLRQWAIQRKEGYFDVANLMLGAGIAFLVEAFVMGLVVPAAPYGPASYYNYDRVAYDAFSSEATGVTAQYGLTAWLDYEAILAATGLPIQFWRMLSAFAVTGFVVRGLDVFEAMQKRAVQKLQDERDRAQRAAFDAQIAARQTAESWTEALVRISSQIAELDDVDSILLDIVKSACKLLDADFMGLALVEGEIPRLMLKYYAESKAAKPVESPLPVENPLLLEVLDQQAAYHSTSGEPAERLQGVCLSCGLTAGALAAVPLKMDTISIGTMWVARGEQRVFTETDLIWLECLADQAVIAIQHGLMTSQLQSLSVTEERTRIAREMHDGLAQVLGYMNVQVQTLDAYLQQGKLDRLQVKLDQMREAVNQAHADVREKILSLRTTLSTEKGVIPAIEEYLEEFGIQAQIATHFENQVQGELDIASLAEVQLVCILQEALTNVRKHAQAQHVAVVLSKQGPTEREYVRLVIQDDGAGFTKVVHKSSFGLQIMRERAQSVNGSLEVHSIPGEGTQVTCAIPCLGRERLAKSSARLEAGKP